jgi:hypothetical protein
MNGNRPFLIGGVIATMAAWGCFQMMETVPLFTPASDAYFFGGYALVAAALVLFALGWARRS